MTEKVLDKILHLYVVGYLKPTPEEIETIKKHICAAVDKRGYDKNRIHFLANKEDAATIAILEDIKKERYPDIDIKIFEADFKKHKRRAFIKRNERALLRCTHVLLVNNGHTPISQESVLQLAESLDKHLYMKNVKVTEGKKDGKG